MNSDYKDGYNDGFQAKHGTPLLRLVESLFSCLALLGIFLATTIPLFLIYKGGHK